MRRATAFVVLVGDALDALAAALRAAPGASRDALAVPRRRRIATGVSAVYLLAYLVAIQDIVLSPSGRFARVASVPSVDVVPQWTDKLLATRAPFLFEPVAAVHPLPQLALLISPGNLLAGSVLGILLGLNVAVASHRAAQLRHCRPRHWSRLLAALPGFLMGLGCCAPTFLLLLGTSFAAALLPVFSPLRPFLFPLAIAMLAAMLALSARSPRMSQRPAAGAPEPGTARGQGGTGPSGTTTTTIGRADAGP
jgi:hypothetical protein